MLSFATCVSLSWSEFNLAVWKACRTDKSFKLEDSKKNSNRSMIKIGKIDVHLIPTFTSLNIKGDMLSVAYCVSLSWSEFNLAVWKACRTHKSFKFEDSKEKSNRSKIKIGKINVHLIPNFTSLNIKGGMLSCAYCVSLSWAEFNLAFWKACRRFKERIK